MLGGAFRFIFGSRGMTDVRSVGTSLPFHFSNLGFAIADEVKKGARVNFSRPRSAEMSGGRLRKQEDACCVVTE